MNVRTIVDAAGRARVNFEERVIVRDDKIRAFAGVLVTRIESANPDASGWYATGSADAIRLFPFGGKTLSKTILDPESIRCFGTDVESAISYSEETLLPSLIEKAKQIAEELESETAL